jgi:GTP-binding protein
VHQGTLKKGSSVAWCKRDGTVSRVKITELLITDGLERVPGESAGPGDICAIAGHPRHQHRRDAGRSRESAAAAADHR